MNLTWKPTVTPDEQAFKAIKTALDSPDCKMLNTGTFYAQDMGPANLTLLRRFFEAHPEYKDKAYISVKGFGKGGDYESLLKDMSIMFVISCLNCRTGTYLRRSPLQQREPRHETRAL